MDIDTVLGTKQAPSKAELKAALGVLVAVAETIREVGSVPSGVLYAQLIGKVTLDGWHGILRNLKNAGLIDDRNHMLVWIGPRLAA